MSRNTPTRPASTPNNTSSGSGFQIPEYIFDDLCSRFIINIPEEERQDLIRIFFQIELAHWFYLDFYCQENPELKACGIKDFSAQIFRHCPTLMVHADNVDKILESWRGYKMAVPTYGAIILDPTLTHCLLVQGYWSKSNWGFPKGKVNEDEGPAVCAIREVYEETGFDISTYLTPENFLEFKLNEQISRLYIIPGVSMDTQFAPRTRKEIRKVDWFRIDQLPAHKKDITCKTHYGLQPNAFFMVIPFIKPLRKWVSRRLGKTPDGIGDGDLNSSGHFKPYPRSQDDTGHNSRRRSKSQCGDLAETVQISEKQRQKQKDFLQHQMQAEYNEYLGFKSPTKTPKLGRDQRTRSASPTGGLQSQWSGNRHANTSPKHNKKHLLRRDANPGSSQPRKSLSAQFQGVADGNHGGRRNRGGGGKNRGDGLFSSDTWLSFKLDLEAVMSAYVS